MSIFSGMNRVLNQFINVIEWTSPDNETMVHRFDTEGREIMMGAALTVRESQVAVFVNEGQLADIFPPGRYELQTENMPIMTLLQSWKYGFNSPFKAEVYFVNTIQFTDRKWGTTNPVMMRDADFGIVRLRAFGSYAVRVTDANAFLKEVFGTSQMYKIDDIDNYLRNMSVSAVSEAIAQSQLPALELAMHYSNLSNIIKDNLNPKFAEMGLSITNFFIENISLPPEVEKAMDTRTSIGAVGDLDAYAKFRATEAMVDAANNPGAVGPGLGVGMGVGQMMGQMMGNVMAPQPQVQAPAPQVQVPAPVPVQPVSQADLIVCPICGQTVNAGKFCSACGATFAPAPQTAGSFCPACGKPLAPGAKFCAECGASIVPAVLKCSGCGKEVEPGTKFCADCGTKIG